MPDWESWGLIGLFLSCFLSATILPLSSEVLVILFLHTGLHDPFSIIATASLGNCLGGLTNYALGFIGNRLARPKEGRILDYAKKYGFYAAFFSWVPFLGDPLLVALGYLKSPFWKTMILMCTGKILRYTLLLSF